MADNTTLNTMTGGDVVAADDIAGVKFQRVKLVEGADGANDGDISSANPLPIEGTVTANLSATDNAVLDAIEADTTSIDGKITACNTGAVVVASGSITATQGTAANLKAEATIAAAQTLATVTTVGTVTTLTGGGVAHDAADSGNPHKVGGRAIATPSTGTNVVAADRTDFIADLDGAQIAKPIPFGELLSERVTNTDGASTALTVFGATVGAKNYIDAITVYNANATAGYVDIRDGTAGTIIWTLPLPVGGGAVQTFPTPLKQPTANTALAFDVSAALTTIYLSFHGYKSKVA